jgi:histidyl-tRNA synthetase
MGAASPNADAEVIALGRQVLNTVGIKNISLEINSIGCPECRKEYHKALKAYFEANVDELCATCKDRLDRNPMRILDCKSPVCSSIAAKAPVVLDYLCDDCKEHFEGVKAYLKAQGIEYTVNPQIVRGLDYYTRTVFEFVSGDIGAQATVCGGGRYDGLISQMGGPQVPSLGFGMGIERLMLVLKNQGIELPEKPKTQLYIAALGDKASLKATEYSALLRDEGYSVQTDVCARGLKAQMKFANKIGAKFLIVLGDDEIEKGKAKLKDMADGSETEINLNEIVEDFGEAIRVQIFKNIAEII